jgi:hypothetical protein
MSIGLSPSALSRTALAPKAARRRTAHPGPLLGYGLAATVSATIWAGIFVAVGRLIG